jgi:type II secretory pathway pseudopilin PulG
MRRSERGFTYLWALAAIATMSAGLATVGPMWAEQSQREREQELIRVAGLYADAITQYAQSSPGTAKQYPSSIDELLLDSRHLSVRRYLRTAYTDPMRPGEPFALVRDREGRIRGVFSTSSARPFSDRGGATSYFDWKFMSKEIR